jgi:putative tricarboxylic transport membrane protein
MEAFGAVASPPVLRPRTGGFLIGEARMILNFQIIANLFFLALGLVYGLGAALLPPAAFGDPNAPKVYPLIIAGLLVVFSIVLLVVELGKQKEGKAEKKVQFKLENEGKLVTFVTVCCVAYALIFEPIGYVVSTFLFLEAIMVFISKGKKMLMPTICALAFAVGVYLLFNNVFGVTLPPMPFLDI